MAKARSKSKNISKSGFTFRGKESASPTRTIGVPGYAIIDGYIETNEKNANLASVRERYKTYSEILANATIVAAGTRYFLNLVAKAKWTFAPAEHPEGEKYAKIAEEMLTTDPATPWHRIVRRAAMYRFYGFSIQEWTAKRRDDGLLTFGDIAPRPQLTIKRWDTEKDGRVLGIAQEDPNTYEEIYIPRAKILYMVDDTLSDSPEGLGLFRHLAAPAQRLFRYEQLEGFGFETDLRGIPIGRGPFSELRQMVTEGEITEVQRVEIEKPIRTFVENHIKTQKLGMMLDSATYVGQDENAKPSAVKQWDIELMKGSSTSFKENAAAIERVNREMARVLGVEQLMLGSDSAGSNAMSRDKTSAFFLVVDGALLEVKEAVADDLLETIWKLNGFPKESKPTINTESIRFVDVEEVAIALRELALAGAPITPDDPVVAAVRENLGMPKPVDTSLADETDAALPAGSEQVVPKPGDEKLPPEEEA